MEGVKLYISIFLSITLIFSCKKQDSKNKELELINHKINDSPKVIKEYDVNEKLVKISYKNNSRLDSVKNYIDEILNDKRVYINDSVQIFKEYSDGKLMSEGRILNDSLKFGWWNFYKNDSLIKSAEYCVLCKDYYLNQLIQIDTTNTNVLEIFYTLKVEKDKYKGKDKYRVDYFVKGLRGDSKYIFYTSDEDNFCGVSKDSTFYHGVELDSNEGSLYLDNLKHHKGFFYNYYYEYNDSLPKDKAVIFDRKIYFDLKEHLEE